MKAWLKAKRLPLMAGAMVVLLVCVYFVYSTGGKAPDEGPTVWYYDLGSQQLFAAPPDSLPPIPAPSNAGAPGGEATGVRALVFSCGKCADVSKRFISYVEKYTPEARAARAVADGGKTVGSRMPTAEKEARGIDSSNAHDGLMIARVDTSKALKEWVWADKSDDAVEALEAEAKGRCAGGETLQACVPSSP